MSKARKTFSYILKIIVIVSAVVGIIMSAAAGKAYFMGGSTVFMYFTVQSNILVALLSLIGGILMIRRQKVSNIWFIIRFVGAVAITLTGTVFCFILAPTLKQAAWNVQNTLTHVVVPVCFVVDFFVTGVLSDIKKRSVIFVTIPPLLYVVYAGIGFAMNWRFSPTTNYPYFFLNWGSPAGAFGFTKGLPFMGTVWWIMALLILLIVVGWLYLVILNFLKRRASR